MSSAERPRLVLVGVGPTTATALEGLAGDFDVVAMLRATGDLDDDAAHCGAEVVTDTSAASLRRVVEEAKPDAVVVSSYDRILPADRVITRGTQAYALSRGAASPA